MKKKKTDEKETGMKVELSKEAKERSKRILALHAQIQKKFGEGAVMYGHAPIIPVPIVPTGSMILDASSGIGGMPRGRIIEIFGPESSGKTTVALSIVAQAQKMGLNCAYIDAEHALDRGYAKKLGVNIDEFMLSQPDSAEQCLDLVKEFADSGVIEVIVLDSVAALAPEKELEGESADQSMGVVARLMSKHCRVIKGVLNKNNCLMIYINQVREKIGVMYGNPETTPGGRALKFYSSIRIRVSKGKTFGGEPPKGHMLNCKFVKNKMAPPFVECEVPIAYGIGVDSAGDLFTIAREWGVIEGGGAHSYFGEGDNKEKIGSSREETVKNLKENPELFKKVDAKVREVLRQKQEQGNVLPQGEVEPEELVEDEPETAEE